MSQSVKRLLRRHCISPYASLRSIAPERRKEYKVNPHYTIKKRMKITIDTQTDTVDDICKILHILTDILQQKGETLSAAAPVDTSNLMSMFDSSAAEKSVPDAPPDLGSFLNLVNKKEEIKKDNVPKVMVY